MASTVWTQEAHELSVRITQLKTDLSDAYAERRLIMKGPEQYSLDTGNTRQFVIKQRLPQLTALIADLKRDIAETQAELGALTGEGGAIATVLQPSF